MLINEIMITSSLLYKGALIFALQDTIFVFVLVHWIKPSGFRQLKWELMGVSLLIWTGIWTVVLTMFWDPVYSFVFPTWAKVWIPITFGSKMGVISFSLWWISIKINEFQLLLFFFLTGFWGVLTHLWAIQCGILTKPPML